jgi:phage-related protein
VQEPCDSRLAAENAKLNLKLFQNWNILMVTAEKRIYWWAGTLDELRSMPDDVKDDIGYGLERAQEGKKAPSAKPLTGLKEFKGGKVLEIVSRTDGDTYRGVYTIEFEEMIYMLDVFQKKSKEGRATPQRDIDRIVGRIKAVRQWRDSSEGKAIVAEQLADLRRRQAELDEKERKDALKPK